MAQLKAWASTMKLIHQLIVNKLKYLEVLTANEGRISLSILINPTPCTIQAYGAPLVPPLAQLLHLQTVVNTNRTPKNVKMIETQ